MKCCDSITSAMAFSTSGLIVGYCAFKSSSGTRMLAFLSLACVTADVSLIFSPCFSIENSIHLALSDESGVAVTPGFSSQETLGEEAVLATLGMTEG